MELQRNYILSNNSRKHRHDTYILFQLLIIMLDRAQTVTVTVSVLVLQLQLVPGLL